MSKLLLAMEEAFWRFPHIAEQTFILLEDQDIVKCREVSRSWKNFITEDKFYKQRIEDNEKRIQELIQRCSEHWKRTISK